jgi:DnaJ-class molecular chaperone
MYYDTLQVSSKATPEELKKQYRKLSLQTHPDRKGGNAELFKRVTEAYEILSNDATRKKYDMTMLPAATFASASPESQDVSVEITLDQAFTGCAVPFQVKGETCYVDIPPGVDTNEVLVVPRPDGNVRVRVVVNNTTALVRNGLDLTYTHPINLKEALCGVSFDIQYFQGQTLKLSTKGTVLSPTYKKIIPNKGMKRDKNCGTLTIGFRIEFPTLTFAQIESLEQIL